MKKEITIIIVVTLLLLAGMTHWYFNQSTSTEPVSDGKSRPCPGDTEIVEMLDENMGSFAKRGQRLTVTKDWYRCNSLERNAIVYYQFSTSQKPIVRIVRAIPGDKFEILRDKTVGAWNIKINGELLMSENGMPYYFGGKPPSTLSLYETANKGVLSEGDVIIFSAISPGANDSGIFGVANVADIVGKVQPASD